MHHPRLMIQIMCVLRLPGDLNVRGSNHQSSFELLPAAASLQHEGAKMCGLDDRLLRSTRRSTSRAKAAVLTLLMLIGTGLAAHAQAPPDITIPRVPDP